MKLTNPLILTLCFALILVLIGVMVGNAIDEKWIERYYEGANSWQNICQRLAN